jgi:hypothetical protein
MPTWKCTVIVSQPEIVAERDVTCALRAVGSFGATEIACALMGTPGVHWALALNSVLCPTILASPSWSPRSWELCFTVHLVEDPRDWC